jgi:hypothetical protein
MRVSTGNGLMQCRLCSELEALVQSACKPASSQLLLGLSEKAILNRNRQQEENVLKAERNLSKHKKACLAIENESIDAGGERQGSEQRQEATA